MHQQCLDEAVQALLAKAAEHQAQADAHQRAGRRGYARHNRIRFAAYGWAAGQLRKTLGGRP